jgi:hypothetical protein
MSFFIYQMNSFNDFQILIICNKIEFPPVIMRLVLKYLNHFHASLIFYIDIKKYFDAGRKITFRADNGLIFKVIKIDHWSIKNNNHYDYYFTDGKISWLRKIDGNKIISFDFWGGDKYYNLAAFVERIKIE